MYIYSTSTRLDGTNIVIQAKLSRVTVLLMIVFILENLNK